MPNKRARPVRKRAATRAPAAAPASRTPLASRTGPAGAASPAPPARTDKRTLRTRLALGQALVELMLARRFDDISVQQVLDRAQVGRATFYAHFRNKHDLLLSDAERFFGFLETSFLESARGSRRVAPVAELFAHVAEFHAFQQSLERSGPAEAVSGLLTGHLAHTIERRLAVLLPKAAGGGLSRTVQSRVLAAALVELLRWWLPRPQRPTPAEMDRQFHAIAWAGLKGASGV